MNFNETDIDIFGRTLWGEARGELEIGQAATGWAILNRALRPQYAGSLAGQQGALVKVCRAPWQFSCWNEDGGNESQRAKMLALSLDDFAHQHDLAVDIVGGIVPDPTGGADSYFTVAHPADVEVWPPSWAASMRCCGVFGSQIFYDSRHGADLQHRTLYLNCVGDDVKALQAKLALFQTGDFNTATEAAVVAYQKAHGLTADGVVGPLTRASMNV